MTVEELRTTQLFKSGKLPAPKLALNCISGQIALETSRHLAHSGVMVTYGGMAREPLTIPVSSLIFKVIKKAVCIYEIQRNIIKIIYFIHYTHRTNIISIHLLFTEPFLQRILDDSLDESEFGIQREGQYV